MEAHSGMEPSAAMREYLAEIYRLQEDSPTVSTTSLADRLNVCLLYTSPDWWC